MTIEICEAWKILHLKSSLGTDNKDKSLLFRLTPMISENITENAGCKPPLMIADIVPTRK